MDELVAKLLEMQARIRRRLLEAQAGNGRETLSEVARQASDDAIFRIDVHAEETLLAFCEEWGRSTPLRLVAEGLDAGGVDFGRGPPRYRLIVDPIDGTRSLMQDKRSAWSLAALAPERGPTTSLTDVCAAAMTELPTRGQTRGLRLWATTAGTAGAERVAVGGGRDDAEPVALAPAAAKDLLYGFATVCNFFPATKELIGAIDDRILAGHLQAIGSPLAAADAEIYTDQYMSSGGLLAELALGRSRFVLDIRPQVHHKLGIGGGHCSHPYDLCPALIAQTAGCVITAPDGRPLATPLVTAGQVAWVGYANRELAATLQPVVDAVLREFGLL